ncbi:MAG: FliH/SctL family protein [Acidimicrobiales bacterium]
MSFPGPEGASSPRTLRRLPASVVPITYANRDVTIESLESFRARAVRDGYEDGYADGQARAALEADRRGEEQSARVNAALASLTDAVEKAQRLDGERRREIQSSAAELAFTLLEELFGRELALSTNPGRDAITRALALDHGTEPATVRLNPRDIEVLGEFSDLEHGRTLTVLADPSVETGGALVEIGRSTLDGRLRTAIERVRGVLVDAVTAVAS